MLISVNGIELYYEKSGEGDKSLILLHGNGENIAIFDRAIPLLSKQFTVYALDSRGHGNSASVSAYHYTDMMEDVYCFIHALKLEKPYVYGFSDGGIIALLLAITYPDELERIAVSGANLYPQGIRKCWLQFFTRLQKHVHDSKMQMMLEEPNISREQLQRIKIPVAVLAGGHDMISRAHTEEIAEGIPDAQLYILPFAGHGSYIVHREKIAKILLKLWK